MVPDLAGYFAANAEVAQRNARAVVPYGRVHASGIPIMPSFAAPHARAQCACVFGLERCATNLPADGGGAGLGGLSDRPSACCAWIRACSSSTPGRRNAETF